MNHHMNHHGSPLHVTVLIIVSKQNESRVFVGGVLQHTVRPTKGWNNYSTGGRVDAALSAVDAGGLAVAQEHDVQAQELNATVAG